MAEHPRINVGPHLAELARTRQREQFFAFVWGAFNVLHEGRDRFDPNWHVEAMCYELQRIGIGDNTRLLITVPPRHLKTVCASVALPAWFLGHYPVRKIIVASYGYDLSGRNLSDLRMLMASPFYKRLFPKTQFTVSAHDLKTSKGGGVKITSVGGSVTGYGADLIIVDDLMKAGDATSPVEREKAKEFYKHSLSSRLDNKKSGAIIAIQQRLHEDDVAAHLIESKTYVHLNLPAIAEEDARIAIGKNRTYHRKKNEVLFAQREPRDVLDSLRASLGPYHFSAQYQQNPVAQGAARIKWTQIKTYDARPEREEFQAVIQSWDTSMTSEPTSDFSACSTWGYHNRHWYLLDVYRNRLDYGDLLKQVLYMRRKWRTDKILIESAGTGLALARALRSEHRLTDCVMACTPSGSKEERFETQVFRLEEGSFLVPSEADWLAEFKHECLAFPKGKNDDMVDTMTQFLHHISSRSGIAFVDRQLNGERPRSMRR